MHRRKKQPKALPAPQKLSIESIAAGGDGYAFVDGQGWYIPYTQPNDVILATPYKCSQNRIYATTTQYFTQTNHQPICPYFKNCGGCKLQHLSNEDYQGWKLGQLKKLLNQGQIVDNINDIIDEVYFAPYHSRRRVTFHLNSQYHLSFYQNNSHNLTPIESCSILEPRLNGILPKLQKWLQRYGSLLGSSCKIHLNLLDNTELTILSSKDISPQLVKPLNDLQEIKEIARLCWHDNNQTRIIWQNKPLLAHWHNISVEIAPMAFLQASQYGEKFLQNKLLEYTQKGKIVIDMFCGVGTFSFTLLEHYKKVMAYDNASLAITYAKEALKQLPQYQGRLQFIERDLFRQPLLGTELSKADMVILDPPRAGAEEAVRQISHSDIQKIVMISCNPKTFIRDAQQLKRAGFAIKRLSMLDQFVFSPHMELIAEISRP
ncbi:MAG: class I SAM-dependent RNA methyltransferase [Alphaproteobacteria bacterium]